MSFLPSPSGAQGRHDPVARMAAQRAAMVPLGKLDGIWRGPAWTLLESGEKHNVTQTERVGSFLDGQVKVIEGKGYEPDGKVAFNAFATISFDPANRTYSLRTYAMGNSGDFPLTPTADGYIWEFPAGPMTIRYTVVIKDGKWHEVGDRIMPGKEPIRFMEMSLVRIGDTDWPAAGAVRHK
jgi:hypothetical protein